MQYNVRIGIDLGNGYTKYRGKMFKTRTRTGKVLNIGNKRENIHSVKFNGIDFVVGEGEMLTGEDKYDNLRYKLCLLTAIADANRRLKNIKAKVCIGLPLLDYYRLKDDVAEKILDWGEQTITVNDREVTIEIVEVDVFIEGALPILEEDMGHILIIDIGSGTINASEWEGMSPLKYDTIKGSFYKVYSDMATYVNNDKGGSFSVEDMERIVLRRKTKTPIKQIMTDISDAYTILEDFVSGSASLIKQKFNTDQIEHIRILGGGAEPSFKYWLDHFPEAELVQNSQFINSEIYEMVANIDHE